MEALLLVAEAWRANDVCADRRHDSVEFSKRNRPIRARGISMSVALIMLPLSQLSPFSDGGESVPESAAPEIEVTPEMIEAGEAELAWHGDWSRTDEEIVARIYRAMILAHRPR
jgi:hypothetical protein